MSTSLEILENVWNSNPGGLMFAQYADALQRNGRSSDAKAVLAQGLANWPRHFAGRMLLGQVNQALGDLEGARVAFQEAVAMDNRSPAALKGLATLLGKQQYQRQAVDLWARLSMLDPDDLEVAQTARKMIQDLETTSSLADLGMAVRDFEDVSFREALTEGASSAPEASKGLSGLEADSPLAGWGQPEASPQAAAGFDLGDLAFATPPSNLNQPTSWAANAGMDSTMGQVPVLKPQETPGPSDSGLSAPRMAPEDSALATIEMASFPSRTIPPPPLEMPRPTHPGNETGTKLLNVAMGEQTEATQLMPRAEVNRVTGDDVGARLDDLFGESELDVGAAGATSFVPPPAPVPAPPSTPSASFRETLPPPPTVVVPPPPPVSPPSLESSALPTRVTGEDIEGRLSEIFESSSDGGLDNLPPPPAPVPAPSASTPPRSNAVTGDDIEARLDDLFGASSVDIPIQEMKGPKSVVRIPDPSSNGPVTGHDVEAKLDAMFGSEAPLASAKDDGEETSAMERSHLIGHDSEIDATATLENMRSFEAAAIAKPFGSTDPSDVDSGGSTLDLPTVGELPTVGSVSDAHRMSGGKDVDSQLDELFASSEFLVEPMPTTPQRAAGTGGPITGDDIGDRLDDLFGADSDFPAGVPTVTLAEEYLRQGYRDQAIAVYRQLLAREPANSEFAARLAQIEAAEG